jgi:HEAT repeat protein
MIASSPKTQSGSFRLGIVLLLGITVVVLSILAFYLIYFLRPPFYQNVAHPDWKIRQSTLETLTPSSFSSKDVLSFLIFALQDEKREVRESALSTLVLWKREPDAFSAILSCLKDPLLQSKTLDLLKGMKQEARPAIPMLLSLLSVPELFPKVLELLIQLEANEVIPPLLELLAHTDPELQSLSQSALQKIPFKSPEQRSLLEESLTHENIRIRLFAAMRLSPQDPSIPQLVPVAVLALTHPDPSVQSWASQQLDLWNFHHQSASSVFILALKDSYEEVSLWALQHCKTFPFQEDALFKEILNLLHYKNKKIHLEVLKTLAIWKEKTLSAFPHLFLFLQNTSDLECRQKTLELLLQLEPDQSRLNGFLHEILQSSSTMLRKTALKILVELKQKGKAFFPQVCFLFESSQNEPASLGVLELPALEAIEAIEAIEALPLLIRSLSTLKESSLPKAFQIISSFLEKSPAPPDLWTEISSLFQKFEPDSETEEFLKRLRLFSLLLESPPLFQKLWPSFPELFDTSFSRLLRSSPSAEVRLALLEIFGITGKKLSQQAHLLLQKLEDPTFPSRQNATQDLGRISNFIGKMIPLLIQSLRDPEERIGECSAQFLKEIHFKEEDFLHPLMIVLEDHDWKIRYRAVLTLGTLGSRSPVLLKFFRELLKKEPEESVQKAILFTLGVQVSEDPEMLSLLIESLANPNLQEEAQKILYRWSSTSTAILPLLLDALTHEKAEIRFSVLLLLERLEAYHTIPRLLERLGETDRRVKQILIQVLKVWIPKMPEYLQLLLTALSSGDENSRETATLLIGNLKTLGMEALPILIQNLQDKEWKIQYRTILALGALAPLNTEVLKALLPFLASSDESLAQSGQWALSEIAKAHPEPFSSFCQQCSEQEPVVFLSLLKILSFLPFSNALSVLLHQWETDPNEEVAREAQNVLKALQGRK